MFVEKKISVYLIFTKIHFQEEEGYKTKGHKFVVYVSKNLHVFFLKYKFRRIYFYIKFNTMKLDNILWTNSVSYNKFYCKKQRKKKGVSIILFH